MAGLEDIMTVDSDDAAATVPVALDAAGVAVPLLQAARVSVTVAAAPSAARRMNGFMYVCSLRKR